MTQDSGPGHDHTGAGSALGDPLIVEDVLLLLFSPSNGTIAGEGTLFYVLGGALLTELAMEEQVTLEDRGALRGTVVTAAGEHAPGDPLLGSAWQQAAKKPAGAQTFLAAVGPTLREPVLDRLVERGHIARESRKRLGIFTTTRLRAGATTHRAELVAAVRSALIDGTTPTPRTAAIIALLSASDSLPTLHRDIPWSGDVYTRAKELERGDGGAQAAGIAVARTAAAIVAGALASAGAVSRS